MIDMHEHHERTAQQMPALYCRHIGTRQGRWLATLKGRSLEHLEDRAARFCAGMGGVRVITEEELDAYSRLSREGFIAIGCRVAA